MSEVLPALLSTSTSRQASYWLGDIPGYRVTQVGSRGFGRPPAPPHCEKLTFPRAEAFSLLTTIWSGGGGHSSFYLSMSGSSELRKGPGLVAGELDLRAETGLFSDWIHYQDECQVCRE